jgi:perosamine synthetase
MIPVPKNTENSYWLYTIKIKNFTKSKRNKLIKGLLKDGIETRPAFYPISEMKAYKKYINKKYDISNQISSSILSLPTSLDLKENIIKKISNLLIKHTKKLHKV